MAATNTIVDQNYTALSCQFLANEGYTAHQMSNFFPPASVIDPRLRGDRRPGRDRKLTLERELELVRDYQQGVKLRVMMVAFGLSKKGIYDVLGRHGIERGRKTKGPAAFADGP